MGTFKTSCSMERTLKSKLDDPATYSGLQIGSTPWKLMVVIIITRIQTWYEKQLLDQ